MKSVNTSIFYVNSMGMMSQWKGQIISIDDTSISIRFSKNKSFKFKLKDLDIDFCLVTNTLVKDLGVCISKATEATCFDENLKQIVLEKTKGNVKYYWNGKCWKNE